MHEIACVVDKTCLPQSIFQPKAASTLTEEIEVEG